MMIDNFLILGTVLSELHDWSGIYGGIFHYSMIFATSGSALLAFFYFWKKGRLDLDEEPKIQMMQEEIVAVESGEDKNGT